MFQSSHLNFQNSNINIQTSTFELPTPNLKFQTPNLKPQTSNLKPRSSNLKLQTSNFKLQIQISNRQIDKSNPSQLLPSLNQHLIRFCKTKSKQMIFRRIGIKNRNGDCGHAMFSSNSFGESGVYFIGDGWVVDRLKICSFTMDWGETCFFQNM